MIMSKENIRATVERLSAHRKALQSIEFHRLSTTVLGMDITEFCAFAYQDSRLGGKESFIDIADHIKSASADFNWVLRNGLFGLTGGLCQTKFVRMLPGVSALDPRTDELLLDLSLQSLNSSSLRLIDDTTLGVFAAGHFAVDVLMQDENCKPALRLVNTLARRIMENDISYRVGYPWFNHEKFGGRDPGSDLGTAHGLTGAIILLRRMRSYLQAAAIPDIDALICKWREYLTTEGDFPAHSHLDSSSKAAWCYGPMVPLISLLFDPVRIQDNQLGIIGLRELLDSHCEDCGLDLTICHGTPGIVHTARILALLTKEEEDIVRFNLWVSKLLNQIDENTPSGSQGGCIVDGVGGRWIVLQSCLLNESVWDDWLFPASNSSASAAQ